MGEAEKKKYIDAVGHYFSPSKIKIVDRVRKHSDRKDLEELKKSILELGQLQPILITREMELHAGGSRLKACEELNRDVWCIFLDEADPIVLKKIQLHENTKRSNLTATEQITLMNEIYQDLLQRTQGRGNQSDLAKELQVSVGLVSEDLKFAEYIQNLPDFFKDCATKTEIRQKARRLERKAEEFVLQRAADSLSGEQRFDSMKTITSVSHEQLQKEKELFAETPDAVQGRENEVESKIKEYNHRLILGKWQDHLVKVKDNQIDLMLLDPPWGIELQEKVESGMLKGDSYDDSELRFLEEFPELIKLCYTKMREGGHLYCFFAIKHYSFVWQTFKKPFGEDDKRGFIGIDRPIVVYKEGRGSGRQGNHWPVSSSEFLAIWKKGRRQMNFGGIKDVQIIPWISSNLKRDLPSAKPPEVYSKILSWSARPGDVVCDPTYGSGAAFLACEQRSDLKLNWFGWEKDPKARRVALMNLTEFQVQLMNGVKEEPPQNVHTVNDLSGKATLKREIKPLPSTYLELTPGSEMWKRYWDAHPEEQSEMLLFRKMKREEGENEND